MYTMPQSLSFVGVTGVFEADVEQFRLSFSGLSSFQKIKGNTKKVLKRMVKTNATEA